MNDVGKRSDIIYFNNGGMKNTNTLLLEINKYLIESKKTFDYIIISSTTGYTALEGINVLKSSDIPIIVCKQDLSDKLSMKKEIQDTLANYCEIYDIPKKFLSSISGNNISNILRKFSQGMKVCIELLTYLIEISKLAAGDRVIIVGGTVRGADTAIACEIETNKGFNVLNIIGFPEK